MVEIVTHEQPRDAMILGGRVGEAIAQIAFGRMALPVSKPREECRRLVRIRQGEMHYLDRHGVEKHLVVGPCGLEVPLFVTSDGGRRNINGDRRGRSGLGAFEVIGEEPCQAEPRCDPESASLAPTG